jgi:hypothetical protein
MDDNMLNNIQQNYQNGNASKEPSNSCDSNNNNNLEKNISPLSEINSNINN